MTSAGPSRARVESLDLLRGVAVLGIFAMNVQAFAHIPAAYDNPAVAPIFSDADRAAWRFATAVFDGKFIVLFTALFGASMLLMLGDDRSLEADDRHHRRMAWLALFGAVHALAIWYGDVLLLYAVAGILANQARGWSAGRLVLVAIPLLLLTTALTASVQALRFAEPDVYLAALKEWRPPPEEVARLTALYAAPWPERLGETAATAGAVQAALVMIYLPRTIGVMLLGMALWRSGFLHARLASGLYLAVAMLAPAGLWAGDWAAQGIIRADFDFLDSAAWRLSLSWISLPQALGYAALVMLAAKTGALRWARAPFTAAGRMALTNYLGCSLAAALIFYGPPGAGLVGTVGRADQVWIVLAFWAVMLAASSLWLTVFRFGPMEWLWRSLVYGRRQPMRRERPGR